MTTPEAQPTVTLHAGDARLEVAPVGATVLRWWVPLLGRDWDLVDGYRDADELAGQDGVRNGIMAPFVNRVAQGCYRWDGVEHDLRPGSEDRLVYHGIVRCEPFVVTALEEAGDVATVRLRCTALADGSAVGYPYRVVVDVAYTLTPDTLTLGITGENVGDSAAPFAMGWHPYFRLPGASSIDRLHLDVPASVEIQTDADLVPLPGEAAYAPVEGVRWAPVADAVLDRAFAGLQGPGASAVSAVLSDPATGVRLALSQDHGLVHVFTGDTLARDRRASIAVEPVEVPTDAFNRADCADAIRLEPGERRAFRAAVIVVR